MGLEPYQNLLERLDSKEPQTKDKYLRDFNYFLQFLKVKDPNSMITKKFYSPQELQKIEDKIVLYITHLKKQELNHSTIKGRKSAIEFFYRANRITLDWKHISDFIPRPTKTREDLPYTTEEIQKMLNAATGERDRFLLYLLSSTGMRIGAVSDLKYGDIELIKPEGYQDKHLYKIMVYRGSRQEYYCFTTFECAEALDSYTNYRKRMGEAITKDSPLLRNPFNANLPQVKKLNKPKHVKSFVYPIYRIAIKAGLRTRTNNRQTQHKNMLDHAFRKTVDTQMIKAEVEYNTKEYLLGHKSSRGLDKHYDRTPVKDRLNQYLKSVELLTISPENRLRKQVAEQEYTIQHKLAEKDNQIEEMMRKQEQFEQLIQSLIDSGQLKPLNVK
jgi:integrase